ncbi:hypothetical protein [Nocardioides mangrovi]|uniref:Mce-associated membrane protein n=1 Tax=Nocardioides mangrovi TaxID=2874580 RepID=A0ABS7UHR2_9ACTN|nr:hypothetical protein [Nocardioides mangrovi]MBZ5740536.1 hypothetical protein [Nocardioides mangrovi]
MTESAPVVTAPTEERRSGVFRIALLGVLVLALLASAGVLVWLLADRRGTADATQSEREAVMSRTDQFVLRVNTFGPNDLDAQDKLTTYQQQVEDVITPKFASDFESDGLPVAEQLVGRAGYGRVAKVLGTGVESIDSDSATVIVAATLTASYPDPKHPNDADKRVDAEADVLRWVVDLVHTDGKWLVDGYSPVSSGSGDGQ